MTQFTKVLTEILKEAEESTGINNFFESAFQCSYNEKYKNITGESLKSNNIEVEFITNFGGEGEGRDYYSVYKFTKDSETIYVKFQGYYQSYDGSEYERFYFVEPKETTVIVFEPITSNIKE